MVLIFLVMLSSMSSVNAAMVDNSSSVPGNAVYTDFAFYYSDQYLWKATLYVAKSDEVYLADTDDATQEYTMDDFYQIGDEPTYISPTSNLRSGWYDGKRPNSDVTQLYMSLDDKVDTLQQLDANGGNYEALPNVELVPRSTVNILVDPGVPLVPNLSDGDILNDGVIVKDPNMVGNIDEVKKYFANEDVAYGLLNHIIDTEMGTTVEDYLSNLEFTINGETRTDWKVEGLLPKNVETTNAEGKTVSNTTSAVQWLIVYEPVSIIYVKDTNRADEAYFAYALSATDYSVMQIKHQMDWRYNENVMSAWVGLQPDAWKPNEERQTVARLAFYLLGNAVITDKTWYGMDASQNMPDGNAAVPYNRWTSVDQLLYGGWGMARLKAPVATNNSPPDMEYRPNTDVIYSTPIMSNMNAGLDSDTITVTYEITGPGGYYYKDTDELVAPVGTEVISYFKWHTPDVDTLTEYNLKITVSPYPLVTIGNTQEDHSSAKVKTGSYEYVNKTLTIRPLEEVTPPDPKVDDVMYGDFNDGLIPPVPNDYDGNPDEIEAAQIISFSAVSEAPYYKDQKIDIQVVSNEDTNYLMLTNETTGDSVQLTPDTVGQGILESMTSRVTAGEIVWTLTFNPSTIGNNHYVVTPLNQTYGSGESKSLDIEVVEDPDYPIIYDVLISPLQDIYDLFYEVVPTPLVYEVYFDTDGGTKMDPLVLEYLSLVERPIDPQKEGYDFKGWYKDPGCTDPWVFETDRVECVTTLYADWEIKDFTVSFDTLGGSTIADQIVQYGECVVEPSNPTRTGYDFNGWFTDVACTVPWNFELYTVSEDTVLYSKWVNSSYEVTFDSQGGSAVNSIEALYDTTIKEPNPPTRLGYEFAGWYHEASCANEWIWETDRVMGDTTLYANWIVSNCTISFEPVGSTIIPDQIVPSGGKITKPVVPNIDGYDLIGWFTEDTYLNEWDFDTTTVIEDTVLYPYLKADESKIIFHPNGGTMISEEYDGWTDKEIITRTMPLVNRYGYTFLGWHQKSDFSDAEVTSLPDKYPVGNIDYYAEWSINQYVVNFIENEGTPVGSQTLDYQSLINESLTTTTRAGYSFAGWFTDTSYSTQWDFANDKIAGNMTLYAKWDADALMVSFEENGGTPEIADVSAYYDDTINEPVSITRYGYTFIGWYSDSGFSNQWDFLNDPVLGNMTLYAQWSMDLYALIDIFPDEGLAEAVRLEINTHADRLSNPIPSIYDKVVTDFDLDQVTEIVVTGTEGKATSIFFSEVHAAGEIADIASLQGIGRLKNLKTLELTNYSITEIPEEIESLTSLESLNLSGNEIETVSDGLWDLNSLETLNLSNNNIDEIGDGIARLENITTVDFSYNEIEELPTALWDAETIVSLNLSNNQIEEISQDIGNLENLKTLNISSNELTELTYSIGDITGIEYINASSNYLDDIPTSYGNLTNLKTFDISDNEYTEIDKNIMTKWESLENFNISSNQIEEIPVTINKLTSLISFNASDNLIDSVPKQITQIETLRDLNLSDNSDLKYLPLSMGDLELDSLSVEGTIIDQLPLSMEPDDVVISPAGLPYGYQTTFDANGGDTTIDSVRTDYEMKMDKPENKPKKAGYEFLGWYIDPECTVAWDFGLDQIFDTTIVYAKWDASEAKIRFESNLGTSCVGLVGLTDEVISDRTMPTTSREGYTFEGWFDNESFGGSAVTQLPNKFPPEETIYYAKWQANPSTIVFHENGGDELGDMNGTTDEVISDRTMPTPVRNGYTFKGWFENSDLTGEVTQLPPKYPIVGDEYFAKWEANPSTITFVENQGTAVDDMTGVTDQVITDRSMPAISPVGYYTFEGWYDNASFTGSPVTELPETYPANGTSYYARFELIKYTVSFDANGGTVSPTSVIGQHGLPVGTLPTPTQYGYTFAGWYTAASGGTQVTSATPITSDITFYAHWTINSYTMTFNATGGTISGSSSITKTYLSAVGTLPTASKTGYTFSGWYTATSGGTQITTSTQITMNQTVYAQWSPIPLTISYNGNGGSVSPSSQTVYYGNSIGSMPTPYRTGYTFTGWYTAASGGSSVPASTVIYSNQTYYAQWIINTYTVTFYGNGGTPSAQSKSVTYGSSIGTLPTPSRSGYDFDGWFTASSGGSQITSSTIVTGNVSYYAHWTAQTRTVTFNANGGSVSPTSKTVNNGSAVGTLPTPTRSGYDFTGWYTTSSGGSQVTAATIVTSNVTYYAHWEEVPMVHVQTTAVLSNRYDTTFMNCGKDGKGCLYGGSHPPYNTAVTHVYVDYGVYGKFTETSWSPIHLAPSPDGVEFWLQYWYIDVDFYVPEGIGKVYRDSGFMNGSSHAYLCNYTPNPATSFNYY